MGQVKTNVEGVLLNECMKETAKVMDKITVVRSMTHGEAAHERGTHNMFTGYRPSPALIHRHLETAQPHHRRTAQSRRRSIRSVAPA